jgi:small subunit ribosomal protein S6
LRRYETTFIVNPQADDAAIDRQVSAVADLIKENGGQVLHENRIGTRRLAYPIAGLVQGYYSTLIFESGTEVLPKLERHYKLEEPYVRYLTIVYDGPLPSEEQSEGTGPEAEGKKKAEETPTAEAAAESAEEKPAEETKTEPAPAEEPAAEAEEPKPTDEAEEEL